MIRKRGQLAATLTWVPAVVIVFFIMVLFMVFATGLAGKKVVSEKNEIVSEQELGSSELEHELGIILGVPLENGKTVKRLIIEWYYLGKKDKSQVGKGEEIKIAVMKLIELGEESRDFSVSYYPFKNIEYATVKKSFDGDRVITRNLFIDGEEIKISLRIT